MRLFGTKRTNQLRCYFCYLDSQRIRCVHHDSCRPLVHCILQAELVQWWRLFCRRRNSISSISRIPHCSSFLTVIPLHSPLFTNETNGVSKFCIIHPHNTVCLAFLIDPILHAGASRVAYGDRYVVIVACSGNAHLIHERTHRCNELINSLEPKAKTMKTERVPLEFLETKRRLDFTLTVFLHKI